MPVEVLVPPLGATVDVLTLISWYKQEGESVLKDEPLFVVQTDKATLDVEAPASGILCRICAQPGEEVVALSRIALIAAPGEPLIPSDLDRSSISHPQELSTIPARPAISSLSPLPCAGEGPGVRADNRIFISPRARRLAEESQIDWKALQGTGPEGAIVERDIQAFLDIKRSRTISPLAQRIAAEEGVDWSQLVGSGPGGRVVRDDISQAIHSRGSTISAVPSEEADDETLAILPVTGVRAVIATRMMQSATTTAPVTLTTETDATELVALRSRLRADEVAVSYNDLLLLILARALREYPRLNASWQGNVIKVWKRVHIGLAVDAEDGLRVPVVRDVDRKGLAEIAGETAALVEAAREGKALPDQMQGGTFTLTNLGMFGIDAFTPVLNLPECAILGVGRIKAQPAVVDDQVVIRQKMWLSLTFDHRLVDGGPAARFLQRIAQLVEKPHLLLT